MSTQDDGRPVASIHPRQLGVVTIQAPVQPFLSITDVCKLIGRSERTVRDWVRSGYLPPPVKFDGVMAWTNYAIAVWLAWVQVAKATD